MYWMNNELPLDKYIQKFVSRKEMIDRYFHFKSGE